jgi:hypothetical protein
MKFTRLMLLEMQIWCDNVLPPIEEHLAVKAIQYFEKLFPMDFLKMQVCITIP